MLVSPNLNELRECLRWLTPRERAEMDSLILNDRFAYARAHPAGLAPLCFVTDRHAPMIPTAFHRAWLDAAIERAAVLLIAARGHAKSEYYSAVMPAWFIGHNPGVRIVHITSTDALATMYSRRLQRVIESENLRQIFPELPGRGAKWTESEWSLDIAGQRDPTWRCAGRGGALTGGRADIIILDDVVTYENSRTDGERKHTVGWFQQTLVPMLVPETGKLLVIGTRYHEDDLYASLLAGGMEALLYPAEDGAGKILWPERFSRTELDARRRPPLGSESAYAAQYLCQPVSAAGEVFRGEWFETVDTIPPLLELWWAWDTAVSDDPSADYTAGVLGGLGADGNVYLLDIARGQWPPYQAKREIIAAWAGSKPLYPQMRGMLCEDTKEGRVLLAWLREGAPDIPVVPTSPGGQDKATRADLVLPYCEAGRVKLRRGTWNEAFLTELKSFTRDMRHRHDDQVDALVYLLARLFNLSLKQRTGGTRIVTLGRH